MDRPLTEVWPSEFNVLLDKLMNIKMHDISDMNETEITDFSEISSRIEVLVGAREPFENFRKNPKPDSQGSTGNSRSSPDYSHLYVANPLLVHLRSVFFNS